MSSPQSVRPTPNVPRNLTPTHFFLRGLAIALPPILTLVILIWIVNGVNGFVIQPISSAVRYAIAQAVVGQRTRSMEGLVTPDGLPELRAVFRNYRVSPQHRIEALESLAKVDPAQREQARADLARRLADGAFVPMGKVAVPYADYLEVADRVGSGLAQTPKTPVGLYAELAMTRYFQSLFHLSAVAVVVCIVTVYSIGRVFTHRLGAWFVVRAGVLVSGVPLVGEIYAAVKRVTDLFFVEREQKYHRVVAIEYPRDGVWSLAFVTGEGMPECSQRLGEPMVNVLVPSAPLPFAGYTMSVKQSEVIDLNMTLDQAFQYVVSCGVIVPPPIKQTSAAPVVQRVVPELPFSNGGGLAQPSGSP